MTLLDRAPELLRADHRHGCPAHPERIEATGYRDAGKTCLACHDCGARRYFDGDLESILAAEDPPAGVPEHEAATVNMRRQGRRVERLMRRRRQAHSAAERRGRRALELPARHRAARSRAPRRAASRSGRPARRTSASSPTSSADPGDHSEPAGPPGARRRHRAGET